jgi:uncharacterized protein with PQ loop repeat
VKAGRPASRKRTVAASVRRPEALYIPQLKKNCQTGATDDLSLKMLLLLAAGLSLWMLYGFMRA